MRFIPYVGTWVGLILPTLFSLATSLSWLQPIEVVGAFAVLELVTANLAEPLLFGLSAGVSPVALLVAAVFWVWLWGPIGLILSTPLTVCLYVLGKYVPQVEFFEVLLGDEPALPASVTYYQRLLARDQDEAINVVEELIQRQSLERALDDTLIPALVLAKRDFERGDLNEDDKCYIIRTTHDLLTNIAVFDSVADTSAKGPDETKNGSMATQAPRVHVVGCPGSDEFDEVALFMLRQLLESKGSDMEVLSAKTLSSEVVALLEKEQPALVIVAALPPGGLSPARYLCKRLHQRFPELKILAGRWGASDTSEAQYRLLSAGAQQIASTLIESRDQAIPLLQALAHLKDSAVNGVASQASR
jgi:hypothetical protein